jgi:hypothetical protein
MVAAAIGLAVFAMTKATWIRVDGVELGIVPNNGASVILGNAAVDIALALALLYFVARLFAAGLLLALGGPLGASWKPSWGQGFKRVVRVAWVSPRRAHVQGVIVLVLACVAYALPPRLSVGGHDIVNVAIERAVGGWLLIGGLVLAQLAIYLIARNPLLAATQLWSSEPVRTKPPRAAAPAKLPSARIERDRQHARPAAVAVVAPVVAPERVPAVTVTIHDSSADSPKFLT